MQSFLVQKGCASIGNYFFSSHNSFLFSFIRQYKVFNLINNKLANSLVRGEALRNTLIVVDVHGEHSEVFDSSLQLI